MSRLVSMAGSVFGAMVIASAAHATQPTRESGPPETGVLQRPSLPDASQHRNDAVTNPRGSTVPGTESTESAARAGIGKDSVGTSRAGSGEQSRGAGGERQREGAGAIHPQGSSGTGASGSGGSGNVLQSDVPQPQR